MTLSHHHTIVTLLHSTVTAQHSQLFIKVYCLLFIVYCFSISKLYVSLKINLKCRQSQLISGTDDVLAILYFIIIFFENMESL